MAFYRMSAPGRVWEGDSGKKKRCLKDIKTLLHNFIVLLDKKYLKISQQKISDSLVFSCLIWCPKFFRLKVSARWNRKQFSNKFSFIIYGKSWFITSLKSFCSKLFWFNKCLNFKHSAQCGFGESPKIRN